MKKNNYIVLFVLFVLFSCKKEITNYFDNGNIKSKGYLLNGKKDGLAIVYYKNGSVKEKGYWKNDKQDGTWNYYYEDG